MLAKSWKFKKNPRSFYEKEEHAAEILPPLAPCIGMFAPGSSGSHAAFMETLQAIGGFILFCLQIVHI